MRLNAQHRTAARRREGFTLLEVVVTAGLLLLTIAAVTLCVVNVSRAGVRLERSMDGDRAARRVAQRLRLLPYCAGSYPQAATARGARALDLVAAVFPHASSGQNTPEARYVAAAGDDEPEGCFVSLLTEAGVQVRCVARFLTGPDGSELGPEGVGGWDAATATAPPAPALSLTLSVAGYRRAVEFTRTAISSASIDAQPTAGAGG